MFEIMVDRDSVCMGDDIDSHEKTIKITRSMKLSDFIEMIINLRYLPYISGSKATWVVRHKNKPLAVIGLKEYETYISDYETKFITGNIDLAELLKDDSEKKIGFGYYAQEDYLLIYKKMKA